ncbi:hypothetical protein [Dyella monticola]|nr:hypothetical protein [Dyella monticola]
MHSHVANHMDIVAAFMAGAVVAALNNNANTNNRNRGRAGV